MKPGRDDTDQQNKHPNYTAKPATNPCEQEFTFCSGKEKFHTDKGKGGVHQDPDLEQAQYFLTLLDETADSFTFQTFADSPEAKEEDRENERLRRHKKYAHIFNGTLEQHAAELTRLNAMGAGIFVTVQETDLRGRADANITRIRAVFQEDDGEGKDLPLEPHIIVESSPGKYHRYLLVDEMPLDGFAPVQNLLIQDYGSDPAVKDTARVLRLPGFYHLKGEPHLVRITNTSGRLPYNRDEIERALPPILETGTSKNKRQIEIEQSNDVLQALSAQGMLRSRRKDSAYNIVCPFNHEHTTESGETETVYYPPNTGGFKTENFKCMHAHCANRTVNDYREELGVSYYVPLTESIAVDLFNTLELPAFPLSLLPEVVAKFAQDQADLMGVDPAAIGMTGIAMAAAAIDDRIEIQPKRHDPTWREQPRLWFGLIGDPSTKKTPAINKAAGPLRRIDREWREGTAKDMDEWKEACDKLTKDDEKPPMPEQRRLIVQDATIEKLGDILSKTRPRGILSLQDELTGWLSSMDAYKNGAGKDRAAWLEAYNGGPKSIDRVIRGSTFVENWSVCVVGGIQPSVVHDYAKNTNHDGMLQRFILLFARDAAQGQDRVPDMDAKRDYEYMLRQLAELEPGADVVRLSEEAHRAREALDAKLLRAVRSHPNKFLSAALGKWNGLFARLLLTYHCIECTHWQECPTSKQVSEETARRVSDLMWNVLLPHAVKFYEGMDATQDDAQGLASLILAQGWERFTVKRDLNRYWKHSRNMKPWQLDNVLDRLEAFGWLLPDTNGGLNERGRPKAYRVNNSVHARFAAHAEQEREWRKEVATMMREIGVKN